jgi:hypothetical protein
VLLLKTILHWIECSKQICNASNACRGRETNINVKKLRCTKGRVKDAYILVNSKYIICKAELLIQDIFLLPSFSFQDLMARKPRSKGTIV